VKLASQYIIKNQEKPSKVTMFLPKYRELIKSPISGAEPFLCFLNKRETVSAMNSSQVPANMVKRM
jgi:hypothetical protein